MHELLFAGIVKGLPCLEASTTILNSLPPSATRPMLPKSGCMSASIMASVGLCHRKEQLVTYDELKKKDTLISEEYFAIDDIVSTTNELRDVGLLSSHYYSVKKLVSMALDRHDKGKEMAAVLLSTLYSEVIDSQQVYKGFYSVNTVDVLAVFIA